MKKKDKILLWQDISTKSPYKVKFQSYDIEGSVDEIYDIGFGGEGLITPIINHVYGLEDIKIYLRPMSSMTKKEKEYFINLTGCDSITENGFGYNEGGTLEDYISLIPFKLLAIVVDWLNKHHFDYRGLIEKGLALEAPKDMYK